MAVPESVFLRKEDLTTNMYDEVIDLISRANLDIVNEQIWAAVDKAKSYLSRYDLIALFGDDTIPKDPTFVSQALRQTVKDIAIFNIAGLSNATYNYEKIEGRYVASIKWLKDIQSGTSIPDGWPLKDMTNATAPEGNLVSGFYNERNTNRT